jgi:hypothetical protein
MVLYPEQYNEAAIRAVGHLRVKNRNSFPSKSKIFGRTSQRRHMARLLAAVAVGEKVTTVKTVFHF